MGLVIASLRAKLIETTAGRTSIHVHTPTVAVRQAHTITPYFSLMPPIVLKDELKEF